MVTECTEHFLTEDINTSNGVSYSKLNSQHIFSGSKFVLDVYNVDSDFRLIGSISFGYFINWSRGRVPTSMVCCTLSKSSILKCK